MLPALSSSRVASYARRLVCFAMLILPLAPLAATPARTATLAQGAAPAPQISLLSLKADGQQGVTGDSNAPSIAEDGTAIAFHSYQGLTADDQNATSDIYVRDLASASTTLVSRVIASGGHPRVNGSLNPDISPDGRYVAYESMLVDSGQPCQVALQLWNLYLFDRVSGTTICLSATAGGQSGDASSGAAAVARGANTVAFASRATNFTLGNLPGGDQNNLQDIFIAEVQRDAAGVPTGTALTILSLGVGGAQANGSSETPDITPDGRYVVFASRATNLSPSDTTTDSDIYRYDRVTGNLLLLTTVIPGDTTRPVIADNGQVIVFQAATPSGGSAVFLYDMGNMVPSSISVGPDGQQIDSADPAISPDGKYVSFSGSGGPYTAVMVYDRAERATYLAAPAYDGGAADDASGRSSLTLANGLRIAFSSRAENLLPNEPYPGSKVSDIFLATFPLVAEIVQGNAQRATVGQPFAQPLAVKVTTTLGTPVAGVPVTFTAPGSGPGATFPGGRLATVTSGGDGLATSPALTANGTAGTYTVLATAGDAGVLAFQLTNNTSANPCDAAGQPPRLVPWQSGTWYLSGVNVPWQTSSGFGADFATVEEWGAHTYSSALTAQMFANLQARGVNSVRWWVFADGRGAPEFDSASGGAVTGLDSTTLPSMADAVRLAAEHDMYIVFNLWSFDMLMQDSTATAKGEHSGGHRDLIVDQARRGSFITKALLPILAYPVPGSEYTIGTHPNVLGWDIINEPEWGISESGAVNAEITQPVSLAAMQRFVAEVTSAIHQHSNQLVTVGSASLKWNSATKGVGNWWSDAALKAYAADGALDFYQIHYYEWMDPWGYSPLDSTPAAAGLDKPTVVGEHPALMPTSGRSLATFLDGVYKKCYGGAWAWSYEGVDAAGAWSTIADPLGQFNAAHASEVNITPPQWSQAEPTAMGRQVAVTPREGVQVTFAEVTESGGTAVLVGESSSTPLPPGFAPGAATPIYDVVTTAGHTGTITLAVAYDATAVANPARLRLLHNEAGTWVDRTAALDRAGQRVVAVVGGLSEFALVEQRFVYMPLIRRR